MNIMSQDIVEKLKFKIESHRKPYQIVWFKKDNEVQVINWCTVFFSIYKNYKNDVWCDVVPMDVNYKFLGRSW